ncbi:MAG: DUF1972 domain-containing protein [Actinobacteria bacterium]|nr:DUF1972 domain-containing protein [Actinomycetota bacterium]
MKVAILGTRGIPSGYSGYETFAEEIGSRLVKRGHDVTIYAHGHMFPERAASYRGIRQIYLPSLKGKNTSQFSHSLLASFKASFSDSDVVLFCNCANGPFGLILRAFGKKCAINVDGLEWMRPKWNGLAKRYFKFGARCSTIFFNRVVTDAQGMQDYYLQNFNCRSTDIAYGADIMYADNPESVRQVGLEPFNYYLIASRLVPDNNADLIVKAFLDSSSQRKLAIAGGTVYKNSFEEALRRMADERVVFLGHIDDFQLVKELHCNAYAYIHGHQFGGTNPALLKGLAYGNCILALDTVFNREVLMDGKYGLLFSKNVKELTGLIDEIDADSERAETFRNKARDRIEERYTWDIITDEYERLFLELVRS